MRLALAIQLLAGLVVIGVLDLAGSAVLMAQDERSQWDGVFTEAQADRGASLFEEYCIVCHGGGLAPDLIGSAFNDTWDGASLGELFEFTQLTMPQNMPGSLTAEEYTDIIAFVLGGGDFPAGSEELPADVDTLNQIVFVAERPTVFAGEGSTSASAGDAEASMPSLTEDEFQRLFQRMLGTWEYQADKSARTGSGAPPQRWIVLYESGGDRTVNYTNTMVNADGEESVSYSVQVLDGRDHDRPSSDRSIARLPVDEHTISTTLKAAGRITSRNTQFFSSDGQRMTIILRAVDEQGQERITSINVYDRVE